MVSQIAPRENFSCPYASGTADCVSLRLSGSLRPRVTNLLAITVGVFVEIVVVLAYEENVFPVQYTKSQIGEMSGCSQDSSDTR